MDFSTVIIVGLANNFREGDHRHRLGRDRDRDGADAIAVARFFKVPWLRRTLRDFQKSKQSQRCFAAIELRPQGDDGGLGDLHRLPNAPLLQ